MSIPITNGTRVVALVASAGLVIASAGFGAVYAYQIGIHHGIVLAGLTILFAVALELIKPLAIHGAFTAFGSWHVGKGLALSILGLVAVAYSLTSELALTASSRGDLVAKREHGASASERALERHTRAKQELATLKSSRPLHELEALVGAAKPVCRVEVASTARRTVCSKPSDLVSELGRAKRRAELEAVLLASEDTLAATPAVKASDPGATAIATYLGTMGVVVAVETLGQWLLLVPVFALELGSALAMVLISAMAPPRASCEATTPRHEPPTVRLEPLPENHVVPQCPKLLTDRNKATRDAVARMIEKHLRDHGGRLSGSERSLARAVGTSKPTLRRAIKSMAGAGVLDLNSTKSGTVLTLLA